MPIVHIVLFEFKSGVEPAVVKDTADRMLALKDNCIHPATKRPYVKSYGGGKNNSPEGMAGGLTHGFVSEFESAEDREYYLEKDPAHLEFVASLKDIIESAKVFDFEAGVY